MDRNSIQETNKKKLQGTKLSVSYDLLLNESEPHFLDWLFIDINESSHIYINFNINRSSDPLTIYDTIKTTFIDDIL